VPDSGVRLCYVDIAICSENLHSPSSSPATSVFDYLSTQSVPCAAITGGGGPILYSFRNSSGEICVPAVDVVDTLGADDIFHGGFCYYYAASRGSVSSLNEVAQAASKSCEAFGTRRWMQESSTQFP
jgi:sugar/nucleoside kinase (ribokinase family)